MRESDSNRRESIVVSRTERAPFEHETTLETDTEEKTAALIEEVEEVEEAEEGVSPAEPRDGTDINAYVPEESTAENATASSKPISADAVSTSEYSSEAHAISGDDKAESAKN